MRHTSDAIGCDVGTATGRIDSWVAAAITDNVQFTDRIVGIGVSRRPVDGAFGLEIALTHTIGSHSDTGRHIVNMLLDMSGNMIFLAGDVLVSARIVLPEIKIGDEEILNLFHRRIELEPLKIPVRAGTLERGRFKVNCVHISELYYAV